MRIVPPLSKCLSSTATIALLLSSVIYVAAQTSTSKPDNSREPANESPSKRVLVLHYYGEENPGRIAFDQNFQSVLRNADTGRIEVYTETLEFYRFPLESQTALMRDYLKRKFAGVKFDVVVAWWDPALDFLLRYRDELFPDVPIVYAATKRPDTRTNISGITGIWGGPKFRETVKLALDVSPETEHVFVINGKLNNDGPADAEVRDELKDLQTTATIHYLIDRPLEEILDTVKNLPDRSVVLCLRQSLGFNNRSISPDDAAALIGQAANAPVYGSVDAWVGNGIVGGEVLSLEQNGKDLANLTLRILNGERPADIPIAEAGSVPIFDWRQLQRFHLNEARLPIGSTIKFRQSSLWEQYKWKMLGVVSLLILQTIFIGSLLIERSKRQRASRVLKESEERFVKAFRANPQPMSLTTLTEGRYVEVNDSFLAVSGYTRSELIQRTSSELNIWPSPNDRAAFVKLLSEQGFVKNVETQLRVKDGSFRVLLSSAELMDVVGQRCILIASSDITERKQSEQQLSELTARLLKAQDDERRHIAEELHDVTAQSIGLILLNLAQVQKATADLDPKSKDRLTESQSLGEEALKDIRTLSYVLHPPLLDHAGLITALQWYVKGFNERSGVQVTFTPTGMNGQRMTPEIEYALFRVVQECLTNIRRHTNSETAEISLANNQTNILLRVRDRGQSHHLPTSKNGDGFESVGVGIPGMRHRLKQLGGQLVVDSDSNGTTVTATVPAKWVNNDSHSVS